jgi:uncharacterized membrane protein SpoIIM required for sporulation
VKETQEAFTARRGADWERLAALVSGGAAWHALPSPTIARAAALYRAVAADLMRARAAGYAPELIARLDGLAAAAHAGLYDAPPYRVGAVWELLTQGFPRTVRRYRRFVAFAAVLFVLPGVIGFVGAHRSRAFALGIMPEEAIEQMEENYSHAPEQGRRSGDNAFMAGFYVYNNVGIAFRCFAMGILFGLGSVFFLVYNGLMIGAVGGLVTAAGHGGNLLTFIASHGAFELTAIVISGAAGMVTGYALIDTGGRTRFGSLRRRAGDIARLVLGAAMMLLIAAALEGFWSPSPVPARIKLTVAAGLWVAVVAYLVFVGRRGAPPS